MEKDVLRVTATDMTFVLGAESYVRRNQYPSDPSGRECLRDFVDLVLNCERMYFTLPGSEDRGTPALIQRLGELLSRLPEAAAINLTPQTELKILDGLIDLAVHRGRDWLRRWLEFQLLNPIVTEGHRVRVGGKMISEQGRQIWTQHRERIMGKVPTGIHPLVPAVKLPKYLEEERNTFNSTDEFLLCYAFDVYRRGWQYLSRVSAADVGATYIPHELRNDALEVATDAWRPLHLSQDLLWSWGGYIVELLDEPEYGHERSPERIAERVLAIREAMDEVGCPRWHHVHVVEEDGAFRPQSPLKGFHQLIEETAHKAGLPFLRERKDRAADRIIGAGIEAIPDIVELIKGVPPVSLIFSGSKFILAILKRVDPDAVGRFESQKRRAMNFFSKGRFGYRGLFPSSDFTHADRGVLGDEGGSDQEGSMTDTPAW